MKQFFKQLFCWHDYMKNYTDLVWIGTERSKTCTKCSKKKILSAGFGMTVEEAETKLKSMMEK